MASKPEGTELIGRADDFLAPLEPLGVPMRFRTHGSICGTLRPVRKNSLATERAAKADTRTLSDYLPTYVSLGDRAAGIVTEQTTIRVDGVKRLQRRVVRTEAMGDDPLPAPRYRYVIA